MNTPKTLRLLADAIEAGNAWVVSSPVSTWGIPHRYGDVELGLTLQVAFKDAGLTDYLPLQELGPALMETEPGVETS